MSHDKKVIVLAFLQNLPESKHEQFNAAYELYKQSEGKNLGTERSLNRIGFTETGLQNMLYDLQQMYHITDLEIADKPAVMSVVEDDQEVDYDAMTKGELVVLAKGLGLELKPSLGKPKMIEAITTLLNTKVEETPAATVSTDAEISETLAGKVIDFTEAQDATAEKFVGESEITPIREEFGFLNNDDCPEVFYIVVGRKISTYRKWQASQQELAAIQGGDKTATEDEVKELAIVAEANYRENQALYNELNHYAATGEILGKHSLFREIVAKKEVDTMTTADLAKYRNSSAKYFSDKKKLLITHANNAGKLAEINQQIEERKYKLSLVDAKLGINDAAK
jgi:hypothetical protein